MSNRRRGGKNGVERKGPPQFEYCPNPPPYVSGSAKPSDAVGGKDIGDEIAMAIQDAVKNRPSLIPGQFQESGSPIWEAAIMQLRDEAMRSKLPDRR